MTRLYLIRFIKAVLALIVFLAPTNLFLNLTEEYAYVTGLKVDYLIPKLYVVDILMLITMVGYFFTRKIKFTLEKNDETYTISFFIALVFLRHLVSIQPVISITTLTAWLVVLLSFRVARKVTFFKTRLFSMALTATLIFQSAVGIIQFILQKSLFGYYFLGETTLTNFAGVAKTSLFGAEKILAYGTTAHPNILGGFLAVYMIFLYARNAHLHKVLSMITFTLATICLILTGSISAILTLILGLYLTGYYARLKAIPYRMLMGVMLGVTVAIPLLIHGVSSITDNASFVRRDVLNRAAIQVVVHNPLGVGIGTFVVGVEEYTQSDEIVRFLQPVHHVPLLMVAELGVLGLIALAYMVKNKPHFITGILVLSPILLLDHYLWSLQPGRILLVTTVWFFAQEFGQERNQHNSKTSS